MLAKVTPAYAQFASNHLALNGNLAEGHRVTHGALRDTAKHRRPCVRAQTLYVRRSPRLGWGNAESRRGPATVADQPAIGPR